MTIGGPFRAALDWSTVEIDCPIAAQIRERIRRFRLVPVLVMRQQRNAYEDESAGIRVTFDRSLRVHPALAGPGRKYRLLQDHVVIMEIKTTSEKNAAGDRLRRKFNLEEIRFSKYCRSVEILGELYPAYQCRPLWSRIFNPNTAVARGE